MSINTALCLTPAFGALLGIIFSIFHIKLHKVPTAPQIPLYNQQITRTSHAHTNTHADQLYNWNRWVFLMFMADLDEVIPETVQSMKANP